MSFSLLVFADATRSLVLAACAVAIARPVVRWLATLPEPRRPWMWALLLAPLLTPTLLVSYVYAPLALRALPVLPGLHFLALLLRFVPVAVVVLHSVPPLASAEALHCHVLLAPTTRQRRLFHLRAAGRGPWLAGGLVFLLAFADFELASLWSLKTWTVTLFDAHTGGLALRESLRLAAWPLALQLAALVAVSRSIGPAPEGAWSPPTPHICRTALAYLACAGFAAALLPLGIITTQAIAGLPTLAENFILTRDLATSVALAWTAAACCRFVAGTACCAGVGVGTRAVAPRRTQQAAPAAKRQQAAAVHTPAWLAAAPGLLGPLVLALFVVTLFQLPLLRAAYDTPVPLLLALTLLLLPLALLLRWRLGSMRDPALHAAALAAHRGLLWRLDGRRRFACFALLFYWAFTEFTASSILAPIGFTPVFARLHNLAHYGQTAVLSAMLLAAFLAPIAVLLLTAPVARFYPRRDGR